jgi:Zn-dependent protease
LKEFLLALPMLLAAMVLHEFAHGYAAFKQGDDTAARRGRLTFNPIPHIDLWMTILLPALLWNMSGGQFLFGGAKPVPVDPRKFRDYRRGDIIVSSAGIIANLCLYVTCLVAMIVIGLLGQAASSPPATLVALQKMFFWGVWLNLLFAFFNLIPMPPLDGSRILFHFLPETARKGYMQIQRFGILILIGILWFFPNVLHVLLLPALVLLRVSLGLAAPFSLQPLGF